MKKNIQLLVGIAAAVIVLVAALSFFVTGEQTYEIPAVAEEESIEPRPDILLEDPYYHVEWDTFEQHRANLHTHTRESDGLYSPSRVIGEYHDLGYTILALADHNNVTWPWQDYGRDPEELGMLDIRANEISDTHHIGSYFNNFDIDGRRYRPILWTTGEPADIDEEGVIREIGKKGGLAVFFHPGRYDYEADYYAWFYEEFEYLIGMEVVNQRDRYPYDREMWDKVLTKLMPHRPVWGFSNDDMHILRDLGHCYNVFLMPELSEERFRTAMEMGQFYFSHGKDAPVINYVTVDNEAGYVHIDADDWDEVVWISEGKVIHHGETLEFRDVPNVGSYVRAKLMGDGNTYTNPFGVWEEGEWSPPPRFHPSD